MKPPLLALLLLPLSASAYDHELRAETDAARVDPQRLAVVWSAMACIAVEGREDAMANIREERAASKIAGVVDLEALHTWQDEAQSYGNDLARAQRALRDLKHKRLKCTAPEVALLLQCSAEPIGAESEECKPLGVRALVELVRDAKAQP